MTRIDKEVEKEASFRALKKAEFKDRLNVIVAAQAKQLQLRDNVHAGMCQGI